MFSIHARPEPDKPVTTWPPLSTIASFFSPRNFGLLDYLGQDVRSGTCTAQGSGLRAGLAFRGSGFRI